VGMSVRLADNFLLRWPYGGRVRSCGDLRCRMEAFPSVVLTVHQPTHLAPILLLASLDQPRPVLEVTREHSRGNHRIKGLVGILLEVQVEPLAVHAIVVTSGELNEPAPAIPMPVARPGVAEDFALPGSRLVVGEVCGSPLVPPLASLGSSATGANP
jgi:hypothetical protein